MNNYTADQARDDVLTPLLNQNLELIKSTSERGNRSIYAHKGERPNRMAELLRQRGFRVEFCSNGGMSVSW